MTNKDNLGELYTSNNEFNANVTITIGNTVANVMANSTTIRIANTSALFQITPLGFGLSATASIPPQGRLTCRSNDPVDSGTANTARTTIYYLPYVGNQVPNFNGSTWELLTIPDAGISLALESNSSNTGYHADNGLFDIYLYNDSGTNRLVTGPAWTSNTVRSQTLTRQAGLLVNNGSQTARYGTGTASTLTMAAYRGTYLGTARMYEAGYTMFYKGGSASGGTAGYLGLWNYYNRIRCCATVIDSGIEYSYTTSTWRSKRASVANRISFISGVAEDTIDTNSYDLVTSYTEGGGTVLEGIGLDVTNSPYRSLSAGIRLEAAAGQYTSSAGTLALAIDPQIGWHFVQRLEIGTASAAFNSDDDPTQMQLFLPC